MNIPLGTFLAALLATSAIAVAQAAEAKPQAESTPYQLTQSVRAVVLDVAVVDHAGRSVAGLKPEDFVVQEDGVTQRVNYFQGTAEHALPASTQGATGQALLAKSGDAPLTILLLDEISTEPEDLAFARKQIADYLQKQPARLSSPTTLMALTGKNLKRLGDYTTDRDVLLRAIRADNDPPSWYVMQNHQVGFKSTNMDTAGERLGIYLGTLKELAAATQPYRTRKNLIWVGPGLPALNQTIPMNGTQLQAIHHAIRGVVSDLVQARVTLYTVDPQGLVVDPTQIARLAANGGNLTSSGGDPDEGELAFEQLAPATGGRIFRMRNDVAVGIASDVTDGTEYYTLSYYPQNKMFDGQFRRVKVTLRDPGLTARTREGYNATPISPDRVELAAQAMAFAVTSGLRYGGVTTTASVPDDATVHVVVSTRDLQWRPEVAPGMQIATVSLVVANIGKDGKAEDYKVQTMHARASADATTAQDAKAEFLVPYKLNDKAALLRVVVRDQGSGRIGSFDVTRSKTPSSGAGR